MPVKINGSTSGSVTLAAPATGSDVTLTLPTLGFGKVLQVVQATTTSAQDVQSTTYTDTGLSCAITPSSSSSKILIFINQAMGVYTNSANVRYAGLKLLRGSTAVWTADRTLMVACGVSADGYAYSRTTVPLTYLDSPATTSATTYKTQICVSSTANTSGAEAQPNTTNSPSSITLIEVGP